MLSRLDNCNALYLGINKGLVHPLQLVQNAAARLVMGLPKYHSVSATISKLHWLLLAGESCLCLAHKAFYNTGSKGIKRLFRRYVPTKQLRSASKNLLVVPRFKKLRLEEEGDGEGGGV